MVPKFEMSTYFYSNVIWRESGHKISTLNRAVYVRPGPIQQYIGRYYKK